MRLWRKLAVGRFALVVLASMLQRLHCVAYREDASVVSLLHTGSKLTVRAGTSPPPSEGPAARASMTSAKYPRLLATAAPVALVPSPAAQKAASQHSASVMDLDESLPILGSGEAVVDAHSAKQDAAFHALAMASYKQSEIAGLSVQQRYALARVQDGLLSFKNILAIIMVVLAAGVVVQCFLGHSSFNRASAASEQGTAQTSASSPNSLRRGFSSALLSVPGVMDSDGSAATADPLASRNLSTGVSSALFGMPITGSSDATAANESESGQSQGTAAEQNRARVEKNRLIMAASLLALSCSVLVISFLAVVAVLIAGLVINIKGWIVMASYANQPCDQPLKWWVLSMLLVPLALTSWGQKVATPVLLAVGFCFLSQCNTCHQTNPELYNYTLLLWNFRAACWVIMQGMSCCLASLIFWLRRNGMLQVEPGPWSAARPGLIKALETVGFSPDLFSEPEPPECPICQEIFSGEEVIKKTPCGHFFHEQCLGKWLENHARSCPLCRLDLQEAVDTGGGSQT